MTTLDRRRFLGGAAAAAGGLALSGPLAALSARAAHAEPTTTGGYGPLSPQPDQRDGVARLALPAGFGYASFGLVGSTMSDGRPTPSAHDGMAAFQLPQDKGRIRLVRNHEVRTPGPAFVPAAMAYDATLGSGGTTTLIFDPADPLNVTSFASLGGTIVNCAGGTTPRNTWLTCEETVQQGGQPHGYVFEVPAAANGPVTSVPLKAMGRFVHEAVAVDPRTGFIYETEDAGSDSGLYRFRPRNAADLAQGGVLEMAVVANATNYDTSSKQTVGNALPVSWVLIDEPDPAVTAPTVFAQGFAKRGARWRRLEGAWFGPQDNAVYFNSTDGGNASAGQVWALRPGVNGAEDTVTLVFESPGAGTLFKPDNITVSPRGNVFLCEDPDRAQQSRLSGLTRAGQLFEFARNIRPDSDGLAGTSAANTDEFAGATFSPDGRYLFVNIQTPGITFAITGPFEAIGPTTGPAPVIPEVPTAALLPVAAAGIIGAAVAFRSRRLGGEEPSA